ncbi:hypothetical protein NPIL_46611 [Nephila pilipes]|uniref:Uncharacterized protein n=1 Tax=Nephila pilipes TaxID=299642 RepID=A0A8X6U2K1_NEPPI|nr:hypothetical protein NPIL_46611 [Nephila pilipes]
MPFVSLSPFKIPIVSNHRRSDNFASETSGEKDRTDRELSIFSLLLFNLPIKVQSNLVSKAAISCPRKCSIPSVNKQAAVSTSDSKCIYTGISLCKQQFPC